MVAAGDNNDNSLDRLTAPMIPSSNCAPVPNARPIRSRLPVAAWRIGRPHVNAAVATP